MNVENVQNGQTTAMKKKRKNTALIVLVILLLPVLIPAAVCVIAGIFLVLAALVGIGAAVLFCAGCCAVAAVCCLAACLFFSVIGIGFAIVLLPTTLSGGLSLLGISLMGLGISLAGGILCWQICRFFLWVTKGLTGWIGGLFHKEKGCSEGKPETEKKENEAEKARTEGMEKEETEKGVAQFVEA